MIATTRYPLEAARSGEQRPKGYKVALIGRNRVIYYRDGV